MNGILKQKRKTKRFIVMRECNELGLVMPKLPGSDECFKLLSHGGFSSIAFIKLLCDQTTINKLYASTLRIGRKHLQILDVLHQSDKLKYCHFIVGTIMANDSKKVKRYGYYDDLEAIGLKNGWTVEAAKNHSKILLFDTDLGQFVLETSSNLNENPKAEQFSFEKDSALYDFYLKNLFE